MSPFTDLFTKISVACGLLATVYLVYHSPAIDSRETPQTQATASIDTPWRYTPLGWQDSNSWKTRAQFPKPAVTQIHPFIWTAMVVLAALGLMVWSSDEAEVDSLVKPRKKKPLSSRASCAECKQCKNFCLRELLPKDSQIQDPFDLVSPG